MKHYGIDWAGKGWLVCCLGDPNREHPITFYPSIQAFWFHEKPDHRVMIDIPIGLNSDSRRECDLLAADYLAERNRRGSIFPVPPRSAVYARNLEEAKAGQPENAGGISNQTWAIVPSIREVDAFLRSTPAARQLFYETHPEVCFSQLAETVESPCESLAKKGTQEGLEQRETVLKQFLDREDDISLGSLKRSFETLTVPDYAPVVSRTGCRDDFLDATVCALSSKLSASTLPSMPESPPVDDHGLRMAIHYPEPDDK